MGEKMKKHFVTFYSPGTFVAEQSVKPINKWNVKEAVKMSKDIKERHGALPYGFVFSTRERKSKELDSRVVKTSCMYYLGGRIRTIESVRKDNKPNEKILLSNMECNKWDRIVENTNSWKWTQPLEKGDVVLTKADME